MITVSERALQMLLSKSVKDRVEVIFYPTFTGATPVTFYDRDIVEKTLAITKKCSDKSSIMFGTTMYSQLDISLYHNFGSDDYRNSVVEVKHFLVFGVTGEECVSDQYFHIETIDQATSEIVTIKAYDTLKVLEKSIGSHVFAGTPIEILNQVNNSVGMRVIDVPIDGSIPPRYADLPNISATFQLSRDENGCKTHRDIVNAVCQLIGVFVQTVPGHDYCSLYTYHEDIDLTVGLQNFKTFSHAKYDAVFTNLQVTGAKGTFVSPRGSAVTNNTYRIEDAPAWDFGTVTGLQARTDNLKDLITDIRYTPGKLTLFTNSIMECGDRIKVEAADGDFEILITEVTWNYQGDTEIESAGDDIAPSAMSSVSRQSNIADASNKLVMYSVTNETEVSIGVEDDPACLCRISFSTIGDTEVIWLGEALIQALADSITVPVTINVVDQQGNPVTVLDSNGNPVVFSGSNSHAGSVTIQVIYKLDGADRDYSPKDEYLAGNHILSMFHTVMVEEQSSHSWEVWLKVLQGNVTISEYKFNGTLMGQNLIATETWGGILTLFDDIGRVISACATQSLTDTLGRQVGEDWEEVIIYDESGDENHKLHKRTLSDDIQDTTSAVTVKNPTESVTITLLYHDAVCFCGENYYAGTDGVLL